MFQSFFQNIYNYVKNYIYIRANKNSNDILVYKNTIPNDKNKQPYNGLNDYYDDIEYCYYPKIKQPSAGAIFFHNATAYNNTSHEKKIV